MTVNLNWKGAMFFCAAIILLGTFSMAYQWYVNEDSKYIETSLNLEELGIKEDLMSEYPIIENIQSEDGMARIYISRESSSQDEINELESYIRGLETAQQLGSIQKDDKTPFCLKAEDGNLVSCKPVLETGEGDQQGYVMRCAPDPQCEKLING